MRHSGESVQRIPANMTRHRPAGALLLLWLAVALAPFAASAMPPLNLEAGTDRIELTRHLFYLHDAGAELDAAEVFAMRERGDGFASLTFGTTFGTTFGFTTGAIWLHGRAHNASHPRTRWLLVLEYALIDHADLYLRYPDGRIVTQRSGDMLPFASRAIRYRHPNFWVDVERGESVEILVRAVSKSSVQLPLRLQTQASFAETARDAQFGLGIYNGILIALLFYNLILWLSLRDASYFWYLFHIAAIGLLMLCLNGLAFEYLWPGLPWLANKSVPLAMALSLIAMHQFARHFLDLPRMWGLGNRLSLGFIGFHVALGLLSLAIDYRIAILAGTAAVFPGVLLIITQALVVLRKGYAPARIFLLAWGVLLLGSLTYASVSFGLLPKTFVTEYGLQIGSALEMVLLSFALAYRYAALRNDNERIVREANEQLERNVERRTAELSQALEQLAEANMRLREVNRRDSLTGVYNRHHFRETLEHLLDDVRYGSAPLSVLMIDIDHFKAINDSHGHLAGDACLRWIADHLHGTLGRQHGVVARFGGEEFVAALPGVAADEARQIAERLRGEIAASPIRVGETDIRLTISIGLHAIEGPASIGSDEAIRQADNALYAAKRDGRDCVRDSDTLPATLD